jgi:hypothetical protein
MKQISAGSRWWRYFGTIQKQVAALGLSASVGLFMGRYLATFTGEPPGTRFSQRA